MVFKRSEYRREFKPSSLVKNIPTYYDHVSYRTHRRELEYAHTPISWGSDVEESESDGNQTTVNKAKEVSVTDHAKEISESDCEQENLVNKSEEDEQGKDVSEEKDAPGRKVNEKKSDEDVTENQDDSDDDRVKLAKEKLSKYDNKENKDLPQKKKELPFSKTKDLEILKPKKVDEKTFVKSSQKQASSKQLSRPKTAPSTRSSSSRLEQRPPFLPYGNGVSERATGTQRTHNVRSTSAVYPAALRAFKKQQIEAAKKKDAELQASIKARRKKILLNQKLERDRASWVSEYHHNYPVYDSTEYAKSWDRVKKCKTVFCF